MTRWFRMYDDVINDPKVMRLEPAMRWHWVAVLCAASKNGGKVPRSADLAFMLRMSEVEAFDIVRALLGAGLVDEVDGEFSPHNWEGRQYKSDSSAERTREYRKRHRDEARDVTSDGARDVTVTVQNRTEQITETDTRAKIRPVPEPSRFDEFWKVYPRRDGSNPRKPAETKFNALVKTGLDPQMLIDEAKKLAVEEGRRGNVGTRFIPRATTWLNEQRWADHAAVAAAADLARPAMTIDEAVAQFVRLGIWSRHAPVNDVTQAPADVLAKYGLTADGRKLPPREAA